VGSLTVGLPAPATIRTDIYVAQQLGFFKKYHVNVTLETLAPPVIIPELASGAVDIAMNGATGIFSPVSSGRSLSIIYDVEANSTDGVIVPENSTVQPRADMSTRQDLMATLMGLSGQRVGVPALNGSAYGSAAAYSSLVVANGGKPFDIIETGSNATTAAELVSGRLAATVESPGYFESVMDAHKARLVINPDDKSVLALTGGVYPATVLHANNEAIAKKSKAVAAFIAGLRYAHRWVTTHTDAQIASALYASGFFAGESAASIAQQLKYDLPFLAPEYGYITSDGWARALKAFVYWGTGLNVAGPKFSYDQIVNMSYWNAATKLGAPS
jgi:ABC-type nitrate/sulfonate/bicarbonate transport system substrate-binding protein